MPKVTHPQEEKLRRTIRDALALDPLITLVSLQNVIELQLKRPIGLPYLIKLKRKVHGEALAEVERSTVNDRVRQLRESYRVLIEGLRRIAYPSANDLEKPSITEKRKALEGIGRMESMLAKLEMDFGVFERQIGKVNIDHRLKPMSEDAMITSVRAFEAWGPVPQMRPIESKRIIDVKATEVKEEKKDEPKPATKQPQSIPIVTGAGLVDAK